MGVDILSVEEGAIDGDVSGQLAQKRGNVCVVDADSRDAAHGSLYHLGGIGVNGQRAAYDVTDAKPIGGPDDGAQIAWVLHAVETKDEVAGGVFVERLVAFFWCPEYCDNLLRMNE